MSVIKSAKKYFSDLHKNNKVKLRKFILGAPTWVILIAIALVVTGFVRNSLILGRADNDMASYWAQGSDISYRHMSLYARGNRADGPDSPALYIDESTSIRTADVVTMRTALQSVVDAGREDKKSSGLDEDGSPKYWEDCYSTDFKDTVSVHTEDANAVANSVQSDIIAVGGNFRIFHPFEYLSGGFLPETCADMNQIVINDELAWRFFKSYDVVGNKIDLFDQTFTIAGVVRESSESIDKIAGVRAARCYIYFQALENFYLTNSDESGSFSSDKEIAITCYEAMLPELVRGVAITDFKNAIPTYSENNPQLYVVDNTGRLGILKIWDFMMPIGQTSETLSDYNFPYWEKVNQLKIQNIFVNIVIIIIGFILLITGIIMLALKLRKITKEIEES